MVTYDDRPWINNYDSDVPATLDYPDDKVMHHYLEETASKYPKSQALITSVKLPVVGRVDNSITYRELNTYADSLAVGLINMGLNKGDRVAIIMPNCTAFAIAYYGILKAGGIVAATNPTYPEARMQYQLDDCDAQIVLTLTLFYDLVKKVQSRTKVKTIITANIKEYFPSVAKFLFTLTREKKDGHRIDLKAGDYWLQDVLSKYAGQKADVDIAQDDVALFQYTGGTTGVSKGAMGTHRALICNTMQLQTWSGLNEGTYRGIPVTSLIYLGALPMFHSYGLVALLTQATAAGGKIVLIPNARDIDEVVDIIGHYKPHVFLGVPALYNAINNHPRVKSGEVSLASFLLNSSGSAPLPSATKAEYESLSGTVIVEGFGMSETPVATHGNPFNGEHRIRSIGLPYPDIDCRIISLDDNITPVPVGDVGELIIAAPNLMKGYHGMPTETANALREIDGKTWLFTGDIARMDEDGYFYIVDRKKDMALIGGFNVYPAAIENVLKQHLDVFEVGVAGIPHPEKQGQEALKAWVVRQPGAKVTSEELVAHCGTRLAAYEIPRRIEFINELPKSVVGKTLRRELVKMETENQDS